MNLKKDADEHTFHENIKKVVDAGHTIKTGIAMAHQAKKENYATPKDCH